MKKVLACQKLGIVAVSSRLESVSIASEAVSDCFRECVKKFQKQVTHFKMSTKNQEK